MEQTQKENMFCIVPYDKLASVFWTHWSLHDNFEDLSKVHYCSLVPMLLWHGCWCQTGGVKGRSHPSWRKAFFAGALNCFSNSNTGFSITRHLIQSASISYTPSKQEAQGLSRQSHSQLPLLPSCLGLVSMYLLSALWPPQSHSHSGPLLPRYLVRET